MRTQYTSFLAFWSSAATASASLRAKRELQASTTTAWPECKIAALTPTECKSLIEEEVANHVIPGIFVKISSPRSDTVLAATVHKVGIPTNYQGIVVGRFDDGQISYPFLWESENGESREVGPWDCSNLGALECCKKIQSDVTDPNINGNYINCFVTERGLEVEHDDFEGVKYFAMVYNVSSEMYERTQVSVEELEVEEAITKSSLDPALSQIESILYYQSVLYEDLIALVDILLVATRARDLGTAQNLVSDIDPVLRASEGPGLYLDASPDSELAQLLSDIVFFINKYEAEGVHPGGYVVIKTDAEDNITHVPELVVDYRIQSTTPAPGSGPDGASGANGPGGPVNGPGGPGVPPGAGGAGGGGIPGWVHGDFGPNGPPVNKFCAKGNGPFPEECGDACNTPADCGPAQDGWKCNMECGPMAMGGGPGPGFGP